MCVSVLRYFKCKDVLKTINQEGKQEPGVGACRPPCVYMRAIYLCYYTPSPNLTLGLLRAEFVFYVQVVKIEYCAKNCSIIFRAIVKFICKTSDIA